MGYAARRRVTATVAGVFVLAASGSGVLAQAAATPAPTPSPTASTWTWSPQEPCRPGFAMRTVEPTPAASSTAKGGHHTTPAPAPVVRCAPTQPVPFPAPAIASADTVGGAGLAAAGLIWAPTGSVPAPPEPPAVSFLVADLTSGQILAARAPHARLRPASTLKVLLAATVLPRLKGTTKVMATQDDVDAAGSRVGMIAGNPYAVDDLFKALLLSSSNDAAYALADAAGGYDQTLAAMNATAARLGAYDTVAKDPSGLDEDGQMSSAYDLALFARAAMADARFRTYVGMRTAKFPGGKDAAGVVHDAFDIANINTFLWNYPGAIGIKTGRTDRAKHTFVGAATRGGRTLLVVWLGALSADWKPTAALLDWTFAHASALTPVGTLVAPGTARRPTPGAATTTTGSTGAPTSASVPTTAPGPSTAASPGAAGSTAAVTGAPATAAGPSGAAGASPATASSGSTGQTGSPPPAWPFVGLAGVVALGAIGVARRAGRRSAAS